MISIIICTHNRASILKYCLTSFTVQTASQALYEIIVIDNASTDATQQEVLSFQTSLPIRYIREDKIGLSHARNRGYQEAVHEWIVYVDDDAKAHSDFLARVHWVIEQFRFECFGGRFFPWYLEPKPKWLPDDFGLFPKLLNEVGELPPTQHAAGGVIIFKKSALIAVGGFPAHLGMKGVEVGYGEENWVQDEMRKKNFRIGFDPELKIDHLVASYKYTLQWQLKRMYAKGRTEKLMGINSHAVNKLWLILKAFLFTIYSLIRNIGKLWSIRKYYIQNYLLDSMGYWCKVMGYVQQKPRNTIT